MQKKMKTHGMRIVDAGRCLAVLSLLALAGCTAVPDGVEPVRSFELSRYLGKWFEIARLDHRFERGLSSVTAEYTLDDDGSVRVVNRGFDRERCAWRESEGRASLQGDPDVGSLSVTFFPPFAGGYHIIALDTRGYDWAMVSGPSRSYLWILARDSSLPADVLESLITQARALGYATDELIRVDHGESDCEPR